MRPPWESLPLAVRDAVEELLGFPVVRADSQRAGFSPGVAACVAGPDGRRAFVKAVSAEVNALAAVLHRDEARFTALLPADHPSPRLLGSYDDGTWVGLVLEHVEGHQPGVPWRDSDLDAAVDVLNRQAAVPAAPGLPTAWDTHGEELRGWQLLLADPPPSLTAWERRHLPELAAWEQRWGAAAEGDRWLHLDARSDNMLVRRDGSAVLVDWPWSCAGDPVFDAIGFVPAAVRDGALGAVPAGTPVKDADPAAVARACEALLGRFTAGRASDPDAVTALVCALAGLMQHRMRQPPPPGMPTVRSFQESQGWVALAWLAHRTGWT